MFEVLFFLSVVAPFVVATLALEPNPQASVKYRAKFKD